jgi:hypothetical protein
VHSINGALEGYNNLNLVLCFVVLYLIYSILPASQVQYDDELPIKPTKYNWRPKSHPFAHTWTTFTTESLAKYDGSATAPDGRILFALRRKVYDVTLGKNFYGPGQYSPFVSPPSNLFVLTIYENAQAVLMKSLRDGMHQEEWRNNLLILKC